MKFILCVGAEKAGTSWLYEYFKTHPEFYPVGKELNVIQRDTLVPTLNDVSFPFQKDIELYFEFFSKLNCLSGDFTHYEGSSENIFRLIKNGFIRKDIEVIPVYLMRDPISRAWSSYNMINSMGSLSLSSLPPANDILLQNYLSCKYKETVLALDSVFSKPIYLFYETMFDQHVIDDLCDRIGINRHPAAVDYNPNKGIYRYGMTDEFKNAFGLSDKNKEAVKFIFERFNNVPWNYQDYT